MLLWPIISGVAKGGDGKIGAISKNRKGKRIMRGVAKKFRGMRQKARGGGTPLSYATAYNFYEAYSFEMLTSPLLCRQYMSRD